MRNFIEKAKLESLVNSGVVTDAHIEDYLQGLEYSKWAEGIKSNYQQYFKDEATRIINGVNVPDSVMYGANGDYTGYKEEWAKSFNELKYEEDGVWVSDLDYISDTVMVDTLETVLQSYEPIDLSAQVAQWKIDNKLEKKYGKDYNGFMVPFMNEDAIALLQVKTLFEMGGTATNVEFSNGVVMPTVAIDFPAFASWFVNERNGYFI